MLFVVFDVETVFLFPWAVKYRVLGLFGLVEMFTKHIGDAALHISRVGVLYSCVRSC